MLYNNVSCGENPPAVEVESLPDGSRRVILSRDFGEVTGPEGEGTSWQGQQVDFILPEGREETVTDIIGEFDLWWDYGAEWTPADTALTLEQRVSDVEDALLALMGL